MARYSIMRVYSVVAPSGEHARLSVAEAERTGRASGVTLEFESVRALPEVPKPSGWGPWVAEARTQLLGPTGSDQQPTGKKSQS
jgi:hypothetical protein